MDNKNIIDVIEENQIPDIPLYMDQITTFMEDKLKNHKRLDTDKILTKTMINNYTKLKMLPPPIKKKYSASHIMLLIIIFHLKSILSMSDIKRMLQSPPYEKYGVNKVYHLFTKLQHLENESFENNGFESGKNKLYKEMENLISSLHLDNDESTKKLITALYLAIDAAAKKQISEKLIDEYFKVPDILPNERR